MEAVAGSDLLHLYDLKAEEGTVDCPDFSVEVAVVSVACDADSQTITFVFHNRSETKVSFGFFTQLSPVSGTGGRGPITVTQAQQKFVSAGEEESHTFALEVNSLLTLTWSAVALDTTEDLTASGRFPPENASGPFGCLDDTAFKPIVDISARCTVTGALVTISVDNTASNVDASVSWAYSGDEGTDLGSETVSAGQQFERDLDAAHGETWIVVVTVDDSDGTGSEEPPVKADVKVDCPTPEIFLEPVCADGKLNAQIDNSDLEFGATLTITEFLSDGAEGLVVYGPETVMAGVGTTVPIDFAYGATYTAILTGQGGAPYQAVSEEIEVTCPAPPVEIAELDCSEYPCLLYTSPRPRDATLSRMPSSA